ncbi:hypothetical protein E2C01_000752 [Portunus trituberculatus]|uniref:Uncharacterized protein n=1 Tax=Portunus trituberculatus TaxID=210409 RepID=A0A5B7CFW2_PORTR|nr:hypothetical protein [Portunus trituberculatus]
METGEPYALPTPLYIHLGRAPTPVVACSLGAVQHVSAQCRQCSETVGVFQCKKSSSSLDGNTVFFRAELVRGRVQFFRERCSETVGVFQCKKSSSCRRLGGGWFGYAGLVLPSVATAPVTEFYL